MYIDRDKARDYVIPPIYFDVERGRVRFFAETVGLTDPIYFDVEEARHRGYRDLVVPPTFLSCSLELEVPNPFGWLAELGADLTKTTHAEQGFTYRAMAYAGDSLVLERKVVDVYTKKGGQLEFVVKQTYVRRDNETLAEVRNVTVLRHPEVNR